MCILQYDVETHSVEFKNKRYKLDKDLLSVEGVNPSKFLQVYKKYIIDLKTPFDLCVLYDEDANYTMPDVVSCDKLYYISKELAKDIREFLFITRLQLKLIPTKIN